MGIFSTTHVRINNTEVNSGPSRIDVHEHKAPTDESVKLFKELREKALKNIIDEIKVDDNVFNFHAIFLMSDMAGTRLCCKFELNEKIFIIDHMIPYRSLMVSREDKLRLIYKLLSEAITKEIILNNKEFLENV